MYCVIGCISEQPDGYFVPNYAYCKGCGVCANECPAHAINMLFEEALQ